MTPADPPNSGTPAPAGRQVLAGWRVGLVGLGRMGLGMARRLAASGAGLTLWNRSIEKAERFVTEFEGAAVVPSPRHVAEASDVVVLTLSDAAAVEAVVFDPVDDRWGVTHGLAEEAVLVDMGATGVTATRDFAGRLRMIGGRWVDAPASGGSDAAEQGALSITVGSSDPDFARIAPLLEVLGSRITHVGAVGAGQIARAASQMIVGMTLDAVAEALTLARRAGIDPATLRQALTGGLADSRVLEVHAARMASGDFRARATARAQYADMRAALALAGELGLDLPGLTANAALWERLVESGRGDLDPAALILAVDSETDTETGT